MCPTLCDPVDCSLPGSSVHGILQARILEWVAISFSGGSSRPRDRSRVSCIAGRRFILWATREEMDYTMDYISNIMTDSVINIELIFLVITMLELCRKMCLFSGYAVWNVWSEMSWYLEITLKCFSKKDKSINRQIDW